ncbi:MAG: MBL fold metallo-hydrolase [Candidatus Brocadiia bacterium]|jgi:glyoxylase-like metal-dependent hydrolase (beta-lactamase superfamily II)|nr:MBL fold metallo-hydrolase [Candidatus Brocadiia bacterium]
MRITCLAVGWLETNCYLVRGEDSSEGLIVDPGGEPDRIVRACREETLEPVYTVNTHAHPDHTGADREVKEAFPGAELCIGADELELLALASGSLPFMVRADAGPPEPDVLLEDGQQLRAGGRVLRVIETPGHSPGSICLLIEDEDPPIVFCGDLIFEGGVGRTDLPGGSTEELKRSIEERIFTLPGETILLPGHEGATTVGAEKRRGVVSAL